MTAQEKREFKWVKVGDGKMPDEPVLGRLEDAEGVYFRMLHSPAQRISPRCTHWAYIPEPEPEPEPVYGSGRLLRDCPVTIRPESEVLAEEQGKRIDELEDAVCVQRMRIDALGTQADLQGHAIDSEVEMRRALEAKVKELESSNAVLVSSLRVQAERANVILDRVGALEAKPVGRCRCYKGPPHLEYCEGWTICGQCGLRP